MKMSFINPIKWTLGPEKSYDTYISLRFPRLLFIFS